MRNKTYLYQLDTITRKLDTKVLVGYISDDFISTMKTLLIQITDNVFMMKKSNYCFKISDTATECDYSVNTIKDKTLYEVAKWIWRINQKRVKHRLESWI